MEIVDKRMSAAEKKDLLRRQLPPHKPFAGSIDGKPVYQEKDLNPCVFGKLRKGMPMFRVPPPYKILFEGVWVEINDLVEEEAWYLNHPR